MCCDTMVPICRKTVTDLNAPLCQHQVRETPVSHITLLAHSDEEAEAHARLLSQRPNLQAVSLLRWAEWQGQHEYPRAPLRLLQADRRARAADAAMASLTTALRSLDVGELVLTAGTLSRLDRYASNPSVRSQSHDALLLLAGLFTRRRSTWVLIPDGGSCRRRMC